MPSEVQAGKPRIDLSRYELSLNGRRVKLERQPMDLLIFFVQRKDQLVTREDIVDKLWGKDVFVDVDQSINAAVRKIRTALKEDPAVSKYLETVVGKGYRFVGAVDIVPQSPTAQPSPSPGELPASKLAPNLAPRVWRVSVAGILLFTAIGTWLWYHRETSSLAHTRFATVAVLPLRNLGSDKSMDFLQLAVPDELVTALTYSPSISVRPFSADREDTRADLDPRTIGRELNAEYVVSGHYLKQGGQLQITLESTEVAGNRILWRETIAGDGDDLIGLRGQITTRVRQRLVPLLSKAEPGAVPGVPKNAEAYSLYLRSLAVTFDDPGNLGGIMLLEQAVKLDPAYAPAWVALGSRYHAEVLPYSNQDNAADIRAIEAFQHALLLDPNLVGAATSLIDRRVERGQLEQAYDEAESLLRRRPDSLDARGTLSYVLRYAGLLEDAARECDYMLAVDPHTPSAPSCAITLLELGKYDRAFEYLQAGPGGDFSKGVAADLFLRQNRVAQMLATMPNTKDSGRELLQACVEKQPASRIAPLVTYYDHINMAAVDSEAKYYQAGWDAVCGQQDAALRMLRRAIEQHYCAYPTMDNDPLLAGIRLEPGFAAVRASAIQCQNDFLKHQAAVR